MTPAKLTDQELVKRIFEGETQMFGTVMSQTQNLVISIVYKMVASSEDRKDLMQEIYLKAYHKLGSFKFNAKLSTWIGTIAYNTCINHLSKKRIPILDINDDKAHSSWQGIEERLTTDVRYRPDDTFYRQERSQIITTEIEKLPPLFKTILTLYHKQELSYKEITTITDLPEGTVKSYLFRARKQLKANLLTNYKKEDL